MAYFTAVITRSGSAWKARDVEVDEHSSLDDLADALRGVAIGNAPVLAVVEHEDEWFAVIRVDGDDEPRLFVSDLYAASRSSYGDLLAPAADVLDDGSGDDDEDDEGDEDTDDEDAAGGGSEPVEITVDAWAGETDLLEDLGVSGKTLRHLVEEHADDPGYVLGEVGEAVGFAELLEALR
ncbi:MAG: tRNA adenosine deaminase-associated protein [Kineosporiaceae bacterium]|nr:tRNA adenosine deaminase-associated protein [Kineosporiaceae bacterium]